MPGPGSPVFYSVSRRHAWNGGVQLTPAEYNQRADVLDVDGGPDVLVLPVPQSELPHRPSRAWIAFFLSPWGFHMADDFIMGHETVPHMSGVPRGRLSTQDDRRNVGIPTRISYGAMVGESDGVAPYGLE